MKRTLRYGSSGAEVAELQKGLNLLPSKLQKLKVDGVYGSKTTTRVREFQGTNGLAPDGVTGPLTWEMFLNLLAQIQQGLPVPPGLPESAADVLRPVVLMIAQQHFGAVDFKQQQGGKPKGLGFLIEMFQLAANVTLSEENFKDPKSKAWIWEPWVGHPSQRKSWCGIFCVYCYRRAGLNVSWNLGTGKPYGSVRLNSWSPSFATDIRQADMGCVASKNHHFLIESVGSNGASAGLTTIDGNQEWGRIQRRWSSNANAHRVGKDNFNYYSFT